MTHSHLIHDDDTVSSDESDSDDSITAFIQPEPELTIIERQKYATRSNRLSPDQTSNYTIRGTALMEKLSAHFPVSDTSSSDITSFEQSRNSQKTVLMDYKNDDYTTSSDDSDEAASKPKKSVTSTRLTDEEIRRLTVNLEREISNGKIPSQRLAENTAKSKLSSLREQSEKESDNESDEESEHSAEIPPMTQKEKNREEKRESMLRYVQKWDDLEEVAVRFDRFPTKCKLSQKELRKLQKEKEIRRRKREIEKRFIVEQVEKQHIKTMDKLKKKYEASKRPPKTGKQQYDPKVASIYDQCIEAKHKKADKKAKEWATLIGMESKQNNVIGGINRENQGSHLNDIAFCDSQISSIDSMIERKQRYLEQMKQRFQDEIISVDQQSDFSEDLAEAYELDEINEEISHLEAIQREYENKQINAANEQSMNAEELAMEMGAIEEILIYLSAKQKHMQKAANKKKRENRMRNALKEDLQKMEDEIEEDVAIDGEVKIDHPVAKDINKLSLGVQEEMKSLKRDMNLKVDPPKEQTRKAALPEPERSMNNANLSEMKYGKKQRNEANELEKLRQENIELTNTIRDIQREHEATENEERFTAWNSTCEDFDENKSGKHSEIGASDTSTPKNEFIENERQNTANMTAWKARFEELEKSFRKQNDILQDEIAEKQYLKDALNGGLKQTKKRKKTQILKTHSAVPWQRDDTVEKTKRESRLKAHSEEIIRDCVTVIGRNRVYLQQKISANLNDHFIVIGTKRFGYNEIYKVMKHKDSAKKWVMLTKYGMVIISASSSKMRKEFVSLIKSRISECFRVF